MPIRKPFLPACFLHWTETPDPGGEDVLRIVSWRRSLTLKGKSFAAFERDVLPLFTGTLGIDDICAKVADVFRKEDVVNAVEMLAAQGIVREGENVVTQITGPDRTAQTGWLSETAPDGPAAQQKLTDAHVVLFGAGQHGAAAARALVAAGIGRLSIVDPTNVMPTDLYFSGLYQPNDIGQNRAQVLHAALAATAGQTQLESHSARPANPDAIRQIIADSSLVLCCLESGESGLIQMLNIACRETRRPWIAASLEGTALVIGPGFFNHDDGPCYTCWRQREISAAPNPQSRFAIEQRLEHLQTDLSDRRENLAGSADIVGGMLSAEAMTVLAGIAASNLDGRFLQIALPGLVMEKHTVLRKPGCSVCGATA